MIALICFPFPYAFWPFMGCRLAALASRKAIVWVLFSFLLLTWHHALWKLLINLWIILQFFISSIRKDCDFQFCIICQKPQTKSDLNAKVTFSFLCQKKMWGFHKRKKLSSDKKCEVSTKLKMQGASLLGKPLGNGMPLCGVELFAFNSGEMHLSCKEGQLCCKCKSSLT